MNTLVKCDACGVPFDFVTAGMRTTKEGDYEVQYFTCPSCLKRHQVLTTDTDTRALIEQCKKIAWKMQLAKAKHFKPKTISRYAKERKALMEQERANVAELRPIGEGILEKLGGAK